MGGIETIYSQNPDGFDLRYEKLHTFEAALDPKAPETNPLPCNVLGYGEISTVFEILIAEFEGLAFKRMSIFESIEELDQYLELFNLYNKLLINKVGIQLPPQGYIALRTPGGRPIFYIIQQKARTDSIGNQVIKSNSREVIFAIFEQVLWELVKVREFNHHNPEQMLAVDGQISNWAIYHQNPDLGEELQLRYLDTSTPLLRLDGVEQLDPELFLRAAPSFLRWILRLLFLDDVLNRYYDLRLVVIDIIANFYKEGLPEFIPDLIALANQIFTQDLGGDPIKPINEKEVRSYYREDALIWTLYLNMRYLDRSFHHLLGRKYPYILPGKIKR